jgi:hypothetical protein
MVGLPLLLVAGLVGTMTSNEEVTVPEQPRPAFRVAAAPALSPPTATPVNFAPAPVARSSVAEVPPADRSQLPARRPSSSVPVAAPIVPRTVSAPPATIASPTLIASRDVVAPGLTATLTKLDAPRAVPDAAPATTATPPPALVPAPSAAPNPTDISAVESILARYRSAFAALDVKAVQAFWPSVNVPALDNAFAQLQLQRFDFDKCQIDITGPRANALCGGTARFVTKIGSHNIRVEPRRWAFHLIRIGGIWIMEGVESR